MPSLDLKTLSLIALVTSVLLPLVLLTGAQFISKGSNATRSLIGGSIAYAVGFLLLSLRGVAPDWMTYFVGNCLVVGGFAEVAYGMHQFLRGNAKRTWMLLLIGATVPSFYWYVVHAPNPSGRVFLSSIFLLPIATTLAIEFLVATRRLSNVNDSAAAAERNLLFGLAAIFGLAALSFFWRAYAFWGVSGEIDPGTFGGRNWGLSFLVGIVLNIALATSLPLLISRRNQRELLKSRQFLEETEQLALVGSVIFDPSTKLLTPNSLMSEWMNLAPHQSTSLDAFLLHIDSSDRPAFELQLSNLMDGKVDRWTAECQMKVHGEETSRWLSVHGGTGHDASGQRQVIISARDITEFKLTAQRAIDARNEADRANTAKSEFLANMSHEIRTPMNGVLGLTRLCLEGELPPRERVLIEKCHDSAQLLLGIVNDVLDFSKIEAGKLTVEAIPFHLDQVLSNARNLFEATAGGKSLLFVLDIADDVPRGLTGDPLRLSQILNNFLSNAVKFTPQGEVRLTVKALHFANQANKVTLQFSVSDTGIGLTAEQRQRIFKPFSQADASTTRKYGGSGLGLVICGRLISLMGGKFDLQSEEGVGSTFIATLPFGISVEAATSPPVESSVRKNRLAGVRILLVEDNPTNVLVATLSLQNDAAVVSHVSDGQQAVDYLRDHHSEVDAVLMDIQMPVMDGYTAARVIRNELQLRELPIIAMTANVLESDRQASKNAGMNAHVGKPFDMAQLVNAILGVLGRQTTTNPPPAHRGNAHGSVDNEQAAVQLLDLKPALDRVGSNTALLRQAAQLFRNDFPNMLHRLRKSESNSTKDQEQVLHTLKGLAATLGMTQLSQRSATLEQSAKLGQLWSREDSLLDLQDLATRSLDALEQALIESGDSAERQVGQGDAEVTHDKPTDSAFAKSILQTLIEQLAQSDMSALSTLAEHQELLQSAYPLHFTKLESAIQALNFEEAAAICRRDIDV